MKRFEYGLCTSLPAFATSLFPLIITIVLSLCSRHKGHAFQHWLVGTIFSGIVAKKSDSGLKRWFFRNVELTHHEKLMAKVFTRLFVLYLLLFMFACSLFWRTLLLSVTYGCSTNVDVDCFEYDNSESFRFWRAFSRLSEDPINCKSVEAQTGNLSVVCYQFVFNIGAASGASYGAFKLSVILVNVITSAMLLHKRARTFTTTRILIAVLFLAFYLAFVVFAVVQSDHQSTTWALNLSSQDMSIYAQLVIVFFTVISLVFYIPWKELVALERGERVLYDTI